MKIKANEEPRGDLALAELTALGRLIEAQPAPPTPHMVPAASMQNRFTGRCLKCGAVATEYSTTWQCAACGAKGNLV